MLWTQVKSTSGLCQVQEEPYKCCLGSTESVTADVLLERCVLLQLAAPQGTDGFLGDALDFGFHSRCAY